MRDSVTNMDQLKINIRLLQDVPLLMKISKGRGKSQIVRGRIVQTFPAVFAIQLDSGETKTFSYADAHTKTIMFLNAKNEEVI